MIEYLIAFLWGIFIFLSFIGYGKLISKYCLKIQANQLFIDASLGLSFTILGGSILNYFNQISRNLLIGYIVFGIFLYLISLLRFDKHNNFWVESWRQIVRGGRVLIFLTVLLCLITVGRYAFSVAFFSFHGTDDQHAYIVFPEKMLQTGNLGIDPFSERRMISSLGAKYFLDAFVLALTEPKNLHLVDGGIGYITFLLSIISYCIYKKLSLGKTAILGLLVSAIPSPSGNITAFYIASCIIFSLLVLMTENDLFQTRVARIFIISLLSSAICALKTNLIPFCATIFILYFFYDYQVSKEKAKSFTDFVFTTILTGLFLLPWMASMYKSSGTLLYPILGSGYYGTNYVTFAGHYLQFNFYSFLRICFEILISLGLYIPLLILGFMQEKSSRAKLSFYSGLVGIAFIIYGVGGYSLYYYTFPFLLPILFFLLIEQIFRKDNTSKIASVMCIVAFLFGFYLQKDLEIVATIKDNIRFDQQIVFGLVNSELISKEEKLQYYKMQNSVPSGEKILARLDRNFVFDFKRNEVYIIDLPGGASLPPGMPFFIGPEKLAEYLLSKSIRYIAYSYGNEANFTKQIGSTMLEPQVNPWLKTETQHAFDFQDNLMKLSKTRRIIYQDEKNFILDIGQRNEEKLTEK